MFSADWLTLREPADFAARSMALTKSIAGVVTLRGPVRALDLATGTGANARYVAEYLEGEQHWLLVDHDPILLAHVPQRMSAWAVARGAQIAAGPDGLRLVRTGHRACHLTTCRADLRALDDPAIFAGRTLVTASALLDLVSEAWLRALADRCREVGAAVLFALTYDGRVRCSPEVTEDETIRQLVNKHQRTDKGFGPALGSDAVAAAERCFTDRGYTVRRERSDWVLLPATHELQQQMIHGWAQAATAIAPSDEASIQRWRAQRLAHVDEHRSQLIVGHEDLAAWLG